MRRTEFITSPANPLLKEIRRAVNRSGLTADGCCVAETLHLLDEALCSHCGVRVVLAGDSVRHTVEPLLSGRDDIRFGVVPDKLLDASNQGVVSLVDPPGWQIQHILRPPQLVLALDGVQDPGNLGTIIRSAEAFGATGLLLLKGTVNAFNPKVVRSSAGSIFRVPFVQGIEPEDALTYLRGTGVDLYAAVPNSTRQLAHADLSRGCAIVIGSEGHGVSEAMRCEARDLSIPTCGVESLNAAVSAAILLYEARRQRSHPA
jgi:TrmH family RNA methyltransferase